MDGAPWMYNNHLLVFHRMKANEDPLQVPMVFFFLYFWIQIHDLPIDLFSKRVVKYFGNFIGEFIDYDTNKLSRDYKSYMRIRVKIDVRRPLKRQKKLILSYSSNPMYVSFQCKKINFVLLHL